MCVIPVVTIPAQTRSNALVLMRETAMSDRAIARQLGVGNKTVSQWRRAAAAVGLEMRTQPMLGVAALADELSVHGISIAQFRRWRRAGLLPPSQRSWHTRGSRSDHAPDVVDQAVNVARAVKRHRSLDQAALALFAAGHPVAEDTIRRVYVTHLATTQRDLRTVSYILRESDAFADAAFETLYQAAAHGGQLAWARRLMRMQGEADGAPVGTAVLSYIDDVSAALLDLPGAAGPMLDRVQRSKIVTAPRREASATMPDVIQATSIYALLAAAEQATLDELEEACAEVTLMFAGLRVLGIEMMFRTAGEDPADHMPPFPTDGALIARLALILTAVKRHPKLGVPVAEWLRGLYEPHSARDAIPALEAALPALQAELLAVAERL